MRCCTKTLRRGDQAGGAGGFAMVMFHVLEPLVEGREPHPHPARLELADDEVVRERIEPDVNLAHEQHRRHRAVRAHGGELRRRPGQQLAQTEEMATGHGAHEARTDRSPRTACSSRRISWA